MPGPRGGPAARAAPAAPPRFQDMTGPLPGIRSRLLASPPACAHIGPAEPSEGWVVLMAVGTEGIEMSLNKRLRVRIAGRIAAIMAAAVTALVPAAPLAADARTPVAGGISTVAGGQGPGPAPAT